MAAAAKAVSTKPFVPGGHQRSSFAADAFLSQGTAAAGGKQEDGAATKRSSTATKPWRAGGPPKTVRAR